jgi:hypothetical protein
VPSRPPRWWGADRRRRRAVPPPVWVLGGVAREGPARLPPMGAADGNHGRNAHRADFVRGRRKRRVLCVVDGPTGPSVIPPRSGDEGAAGRGRTPRHEPGQYGHRRQSCQERPPWAKGTQPPEVIRPRRRFRTTEGNGPGEGGCEFPPPPALPLDGGRDRPQPASGEEVERTPHDPGAPPTGTHSPTAIAIAATCRPVTAAGDGGGSRPPGGTFTRMSADDAGVIRTL